MSQYEDITTKSMYTCKYVVCNHDHFLSTLGNEKIVTTNSVELLGVTMDNKLNFTDLVSELCKKGNLEPACPC